MTDRTRVAARSADALSEVYAPGREPGGYARWRDDGGRARHEWLAARSRTRVAWVLWCRVHPERAECRPIDATNYRRAPEVVSPCA